MKGIYLIVIAFLASRTVTAEERYPTRCPAVNPDDRTIMIPHRSDCTKFYMCLGGEEIEKQCPYMNKYGDRLHFNSREQVCDWPDRAGCREYPVQDQVEEANEQSVLEEDESSIMNKIPTRCPAIDPDDRTIMLPHKSDCTKFYMCQAGEKIERQCPYMNKHGDRLHFNPRKQVCDWPNRAGCRKYPVQDQAEVTNEQLTELIEINNTPTTLNKIPTKCPAKDPKDTTIHLAHKDCTKFYMCQAGRKIERQCPYMNEHGDRLHFNPRKQVCDWPDRAGCKSNPWPGDKKCKEGRYLPHESSCSLFYLCKDGRKILRECEFDKYFSKKWQRCVDYEDSECANKRPPSECSRNGLLLPHECDCSKYYKCIDNEQILARCERGLHFNVKHQRCVDPDESDCENKLMTSSKNIEIQDLKVSDLEDRKEEAQ